MFIQCHLRGSTLDCLGSNGNSNLWALGPATLLYYWAKQIFCILVIWMPHLKHNFNPYSNCCPCHIPIRWPKSKRKSKISLYCFRCTRLSLIPLDPYMSDQDRSQMISSNISSNKWVWYDESDFSEESPDSLQTSDPHIIKIRACNLKTETLVSKYNDLD